MVSIFQRPGGWSPPKSNGGGHVRTSARIVVCRCPLSGSGSGSGSIKKTRFLDKKRLPLPPGPSPLHLIGLLHYLIRSLPYHYPLRDLAQTYGPLLHFKVGQLPIVVVLSPAMAKELLKTNDVVCADRPRYKVAEVVSYGYRDIVLSPYGDYWKQIRHICIAELLSAKNVRSFDRIRSEQASLLVDGIRSSPSLDLTEKIFNFMNSATCRAVLGNVAIDGERVVIMIRRASAAVGSVEMADLFPSIELLDLFSFKKREMLKAMPEMDKILDHVIDKHRENRAATGKGFGEMGTEDLVDDMFAGGTESASSAVEWTMAELVRNPGVMKKLQAEIREAFHRRKTMEETEIRKLSYLKSVVKESMRLHPPNPLIPRSCRDDVEINGYRILRNAAVVVNAWWLGRDPSNWSEPERFEPERFEGNSVDYLGNHFKYIPFGAGKKICPGIAFAVANIEFLLAQLLYYFDWKLPAGMAAEDLDMTEGGGFALSRRSSLNLIATPYAPAFNDVVAS